MVPVGLVLATASGVRAAAVTFDGIALSLVPAESTTGSDAVDPSGKLYLEIATALGTSDPSGYDSEVVILPDGMMTVPMDAAQVQLSHPLDSTEQGARSISIIGTSSFSDDTNTPVEQVEIMAIISWDNAGDDNPATAIVMKTSSDMLSNWVPVPAGQDPALSQALLAIRRPSSSLSLIHI